MRLAPVAVRLRGRRSSPGCRDRSRPRWSSGCTLTRWHGRCIPAGGAVDPIERVLVALVEIQGSRAHRIVGAWTYVIRSIGKSVFHLRGGNPCRPFFLASDLSYAGPCERLLADRDTVANGLGLR